MRSTTPKKNLTKTQRDALELLRVRLDPTSPAFRGSDEVREALEQARLYVNSWVLPLIDLAMNGESFYGEAGSVGNDAAFARNALKRFALNEPMDLAEREQFARCGK
jgi:hypothetical protein